MQDHWIRLSNTFVPSIHAGFRFPLFMTLAHMAFSFISLLPIMATPSFREVHVPTLKKQWPGILAIGAFFAVNVSCWKNGPGLSVHHTHANTYTCITHMHILSCSLSDWPQQHQSDVGSSFSEPSHQSRDPRRDRIGVCFHREQGPNTARVHITAHYRPGGRLHGV